MHVTSSRLTKKYIWYSQIKSPSESYRDCHKAGGSSRWCHEEGRWGCQWSCWRQNRETWGVQHTDGFGCRPWCQWTCRGCSSWWSEERGGGHSCRCPRGHCYPYKEIYFFLNERGNHVGDLQDIDIICVVDDGSYTTRILVAVDDEALGGLVSWNVLL